MTKNKADPQKSKLRVDLAVLLATGIILMLSFLDTTSMLSFVSDQWYFMQAKTAVRERLKDPDSAKFRNLRLVQPSEVMDLTVCGEVNARNALGGYAGYDVFYVYFLNDSHLVGFDYDSGYDYDSALGRLRCDDALP